MRPPAKARRRVAVADRATDAQLPVRTATPRELLLVGVQALVVFAISYGVVGVLLVLLGADLGSGPVATYVILTVLTAASAVWRHYKNPGPAPRRKG